MITKIINKIKTFLIQIKEKIIILFMLFYFNIMRIIIFQNKHQLKIFLIILYLRMIIYILLLLFKYSDTDNIILFFQGFYPYLVDVIEFLKIKPTFCMDGDSSQNDSDEEMGSGYDSDYDYYSDERMDSSQKNSGSGSGSGSDSGSSISSDIFKQIEAEGTGKLTLENKQIILNSLKEHKLGFRDILVNIDSDKAKPIQELHNDFNIHISQAPAAKIDSIFIKNYITCTENSISEISTLKETDRFFQINLTLENLKFNLNSLQEKFITNRTNLQVRDLDLLNTEITKLDNDQVNLLKSNKVCYNKAIEFNKQLLRLPNN